MPYLGEDVPKLGFGLLRLPRFADGKERHIGFSHHDNAGYSSQSDSLRYFSSSASSSVRPATSRILPRR